MRGLVSKRQSHKQHGRRTIVGLLSAVFATWLGASPAQADDPPPAPPAAPAPTPAPPATPTLPATPEDAQAPRKPGVLVQADDQTEWPIGRMDPPRETLEWHGGLETDIAYARYGFPAGISPREDFFDFRGRFVVGPLLNHSFGDDYFVRARGEVVAWVREQPGVYQVNVDDVYAQVGKRGLFDFKIGRFRSWRVFQKGYGFDLYTLEDTGALRTGPIDNGNFGPHTYEVSYMYMRGVPGRAAFHLYPSTWSGIELLGEYGKDSILNTVGFRGAGLLHWSFLRVSAAGEYRYGRPAQQITNSDAAMTVCDTCGVRKQFGGGGSAEVVIKQAGLRLAGDYAYGRQTNIALATGMPDQQNSSKIQSLGGFLEFDLGSLVMHRSLIFGGAFYQTEQTDDRADYDRHRQSAAYVVFPLGFNDALIKIVGSRADLEVAEAARAPYTTNMYALRFRVAYYF